MNNFDCLEFFTHILRIWRIIEMSVLFTSKDRFFIKQFFLRCNLYIINLPVLSVKFKGYQTDLVLLPNASQTVLRMESFSPTPNSYGYLESYSCHNNLILAHFHHSKNKSHVHLQSPLTPSPPPQATINLFSVSICLLFWIFHVNGII